LPQRRKKLTAVRRKQKKPKEDTDDSDKEHELEVPELAIEHNEEEAPEVFSMPLLAAEVSEPIIALKINAPKKRGRPTNAEKALRFEQSQAVEQPAIRLSSRLSQKHKKL
jgi:hypothetical protein